jgi:hypothetical protein
LIEILENGGYELYTGKPDVGKKKETVLNEFESEMRSKNFAGRTASAIKAKIIQWEGI